MAAATSLIFLVGCGGGAAIGKLQAINLSSAARTEDFSISKVKAAPFS